MSPQHLSLDPALLEILKDLEKRDTQSLFVPSPTQLVRGLRDGSARLRTGQAGHSAAFNELLRVHREELAYALFSRAHQLLLEMPGEIWQLKERHIDSDDARQCSLDLTAISSMANSNWPKEHLAIEASATQAIREGDASRMLSTSLRLAPRDSARIHWAVSLEYDGELNTSIRVLQEIEETTTSRVNSSCAAQASAVISWRQENYCDALRRFVRAEEHDHSARDAGAFALAMALMAGDSASVARFSAYVDEAFESDPHSLDRVEQDLIRIPTSRISTENQKANIARIIESSSQPTMRIAHAIHRNERP